MSTRRLFDIDGRTERYRSVLRENWFTYLLIMPVLLFLIVLMWLPFLQGIYMSFNEWPFGGDPTWIGAANYEFLLNWEPFYTSLKATAIFSLTTVFQLGVALAAALAVRELRRGKSFVSAAFLLSYTMPPLVIGTIWAYLLEPDFGPVFGYLTELNVLGETIYWGSSGPMSLAVVMFVTTWTFWPFMFLIISASLESIPEELYESARMYGAGPVQTFLRVTLPQLKSAILVALSIRIIWNMTKISQVLQLTNGGPGYDTSILAVLLYQFAYERGQMGISYAIGIVLLVMTLGFVFVFIREFERASEGAGA
ncbi:carbohydrate ABC transporter permease [Natrialba aegyptia]|uniref:Binding-protein-dependent transport system inner membrane protein n=1 Tax=Natrialba aegyptia DSM 13077 TaxID=1227491 RepID=M0AW44_9EURY|nr:sugar ABC transporter permease [Natrialba aegyptia]ELZ02188.1 binding-protein-dependent transport system inner membrane protein [Natrialba aegyptia DSM 13077]